MRKRFTCYLFFLALLQTFVVSAKPAPPSRTYTANSVLSTGTWYKLGITNAGIYKLDKSFLQSVGIAADGINPQHLKLYGNGGQMLPQLNSTPRPDDLTENAIYIAGEADGKFDNTDYILFYAPGPHRWQLEQDKKQFVHQTNFYADTAYYFLTVSATPSRRIKLSPTLPSTNQIVTTFTERIYHEQDLFNALQSGRNWYGEAFNNINLSRNFNFPLTDIVPGSNILLSSAVMSNSPNGSKFDLKLNNAMVGSQTFTGRGSYDYHAEGEHQLQTFKIAANNLSANNLQVSLTYNQQGTSDAVGYLDYLEINVERKLRLYGNQTAFRSFQNLGSTTPVTYKIENIASDATVWEITNPLLPRSYSLQKENGIGLFSAKADSLREFIVFNGDDFPIPFSLGKIENQNLHALNLEGKLDLVILTHPLYKLSAEKLANHRRQHDNLQVEVVTTTQVYNEFSSGSPDITAIRDFMKMLYDRRTKSGEEVLYLLLFGDASFDFKSGINAQGRTPNNTNFVPTYESRQSLDPLESYSSDDYFGLLDDNEGFWSEENFSITEDLDIGIGRLPVKTVAEAESIVSKLIHYDSPASFGKWRNQVTFVADDGDGNEHLRDAESLTSLLEQIKPDYLSKKIYLDIYKQETVPNGQRSPLTNTEINKAVEQGSLILNYTGHGNETTLASEQILTLPQINAWQNYDKLTFMLTATCEFGRYDDPKRNSGAETALLNPRGGAIGLVTTTRPVYANSNRILNRNFLQAAFKPINNTHPRLGDIVRVTKNNSQAKLNNRNFTLLGDPSQRLAYPDLKAAVTTINNVPVSTPDTLQSLKKISLVGNITDATNNTMPDFDGTIQVTVFEKPSKIKTLGDEDGGNQNSIQEIQVKENIIYNGTATVKKGLWELSFVVPKDISYQVGTSQISLYAYNQTVDANGILQSVPIGGTAKDIVPDNTPPQIQLYMDDLSFVSGGLTSNNPTLLAKLFDENGINTSNTGIGHEITAYMDGDKSKTIILNNFFSAKADNFTSGDIQYLLSDLSLGPHQITLKAWDTHNNSTEAQLNFTVTDSEKLIISEVKNFPNPVVDHTTFQFDYNQAGENLYIEIHIFDVTGKVVRTITTEYPGTSTSMPRIKWNGRNESGDLLRSGIYLYRIIARSSKDTTEVSKVNKLIKIK